MGESYEAAVWLLRRIDDLPEGVIHRDWIDFTTIIGERYWSAGEFAVIQAAQDLYNGMGGCKLAQVIASCDDSFFAAVIEAMQRRRPSAFDTNLVPAS